MTADLKFFRVFIILVLILLTSSARADWVNLTGAQSALNIAEIHVNDDHVRIVLEIYVGDLDKFVDLLPDAWIHRAGMEPAPIKERMQRFSAKTLQIIVDDHNRLQAERTMAEPRMRIKRPNPFAGMINPVTRQPVPGPPEDKRVLYVELVYPFVSKPKSVTIIPPLEKSGIPAASIGFIAYHKGVPVVDYRYLSEPVRMNLDWEDPWYSRFDSKDLKRWQQSGLLTFLYIEPYEVRHETLVRIKDAKAWMDLNLRGKEFIEVNEVEPLKKKIGEFLQQHSNVTIDGKKLRPILDRSSFIKYTMTRTFFIDKPERMPLNTAMLGVVITYLTQGIPQEVRVDWDLFSDRIQKVPTIAIDPAGPFSSYVSPDDNVLIWQNFLKTYQMPTVARVVVDDSYTKLRIPVGSLLSLAVLMPFVFIIRKQKKRNKSIRRHLLIVGLLVGGGILSLPFFQVSMARPSVIPTKLNDKEAVVILENLLKNIYRSFDFREEEDVYDRLATSVSGDLLTDIYLQNRKSMKVTQAGGAQAKVKEIDIQDVSVKHLDDRPLALLFHSKWTAMGTVGHWGHIHMRKNQYEANITVEPVDGAWKITDLELLEEKRIDPYANPKA